MVCTKKTAQAKSEMKKNGAVSTPVSTAFPSINNNPAFKAWFGNSRAVDDDGKPLILYHGSPVHDIDVFQKTSARRTGFYGEFEVEAQCFFFSGEPDVADFFARNRSENGEAYSVYPCYLKMENPLDMSSVSPELIEVLIDSGEYSFYDADGYPYPSFAIYNEDGEINEQVYEDIAYELNVNIELPQLHSLVDDAEFVAKMKENGYDSFFVLEDNGSVSYAVMSPNQIKSAIHNNGDFDPENPNQNA